MDRQSQRPQPNEPVAPASRRQTAPVGTTPLARDIVNVMDRQAILDRLRDHEAALRARGVAHAALFGSRSRGDARTDSDIDIMIDVAPDARVGVWDYVGLKAYIADLFAGPVDVVNRDALKPHLRPAALTDAVYAF